MYKKICIVFLTLLICLTTILLIPKDIRLKASEEDYGGPELDYDFIDEILENLSSIIMEYPEGREFGYDGENEASIYIQDCMNEINLLNVSDHGDVSRARIRNKYWSGLKWTPPAHYHGDRYTGGYLPDRQTPTHWYLHIKVYNTSNWDIVDEKNLTSDYNSNYCYPLLLQPPKNLGYEHNISFKNVTVKDNYDQDGGEQFVLLETDWTVPYGWMYDGDGVPDSVDDLEKKSNVKGFILRDGNGLNDFFDGTVMMACSENILDELGGCSINGSDGKWLADHGQFEIS